MPNESEHDAKVDLILHTLADDDVIVVWVDKTADDIDPDRIYHFALPSANNCTSDDNFFLIPEIKVVCGKIIKEESTDDVVDNVMFDLDMNQLPISCFCKPCLNWLMHNQEILPYKLTLRNTVAVNLKKSKELIVEKKHE
jgi:hypothetical protein